MAEIILLRHGQASFGAANYDQLSPLGYQQAQWLGEHFQQLGLRFDRLVHGTLQRQQQTAQGVLDGLAPTGDTPPVTVLAGLNEFAFSALMQPLSEHYAQQWVDTGQPQRDFYQNMLFAMQLWMGGELPVGVVCEPWAVFRERVLQAFRQVADHGASRQLVISSGGPIAIILAETMGLDEERLRRLLLQIKNSSCSRILYNGHHFTVDSFNEIPHLLTRQRQHAITFA